MCGGGGGGGSSEAAAMERERQRRIEETVRRINELFGDPAREQIYEQQAQAVGERLQMQLDEQRADADRMIRQALARRALLGGSADIDAQREIAERYSEGLLQAQARARDAAAGLRQADEEAKQRLIALAQGGLDVGTAAQQALAAMRANAEAARAQYGAAQLGDLFGGLAQVYQLGQVARGRRAAERENPYGTYFPRRGGYAGRVTGY